MFCTAMLRASSAFSPVIEMFGKVTSNYNHCKCKCGFSGVTIFEVETVKTKIIFQLLDSILRIPAASVNPLKDENSTLQASSDLIAQMFPT